MRGIEQGVRNKDLDGQQALAIMDIFKKDWELGLLMI